MSVRRAPSGVDQHAHLRSLLTPIEIRLDDPSFFDELTPGVPIRRLKMGRHTLMLIGACRVCTFDVCACACLCMCALVCFVLHAPFAYFYADEEGSVYAFGKAGSGACVRGGVLFERANNTFSPAHVQVSLAWTHRAWRQAHTCSSRCVCACPSQYTLYPWARITRCL